METKSVNSMTPVAANASRKMLSGDGAIELSAIKAFVLAETNTSLASLSGELAASKNSIQSNTGRISAVETRASDLENELKSVESSVASIASGGLVFAAIKFSLVQNGEVVPDEYGYLVMEKSSDGSISPAYLSQAEFDEIYGGENE